MKTKFVAEISSNHNKDLKRCLRFVDVASEIGCDAVKFQLFRVNELFAPAILNKSSKHQEREAWELPIEYIEPIVTRCREKQILFSCTPFYLKAVEELLPYVDFYKIASYELLWNDLLDAVSRTGKPVVLSTGMATLDEVKEAVEVIRKTGCQDLTLLHCVSGYPTPVSECNLAAIETLRNELHKQQSTIRIQLGWSDHTVNPAVIYRAVYHWDASMVEFHLDLEGKGKEFSGGHCWLPQEIGAVIKSVREGESADGNGDKTPSEIEMTERDWRADPGDGLRPLKKIRDVWQG